MLNCVGGKAFFLLWRGKQSISGCSAVSASQAWSTWMSFLVLTFIWPPFVTCFQPSLLEMYCCAYFSSFVSLFCEGVWRGRSRWAWMGVTWDQQTQIIFAAGQTQFIKVQKRVDALMEIQFYAYSYRSDPSDLSVRGDLSNLEECFDLRLIGGPSLVTGNKSECCHGNGGWAALINRRFSLCAHFLLSELYAVLCWFCFCYFVAPWSWWDVVFCVNDSKPTRLKHLNTFH